MICQWNLQQLPKFYVSVEYLSQFNTVISMGRISINMKNNTPYQFVFFTDVSDTPCVSKTIGAYKCASVLRSAGYSCLVVDHLHSYSEEELDELLTKVITNETLGVGVSSTFIRSSSVPLNSTEKPILFFKQSGEDRAVIKIKQLNVNCKILIGGGNAFSYSENRNIDYILVGFSESSIINLADHLTKQTPLTNAVRNLWGVTIIDDRRAESHDFKNTVFKWIDTDVVNAKVLPIELSRGCIFKCKFCSYPMNGRQNLDFVKDIDLLRAELQSNYDQFGIYTYRIVDDTFNDNDYKIDLILAAVRQLTFQPIFWAYIRLDLLHSKQHFDKLYAIGVRACYFGIETLNKKAGSIVGKGLDSAKQIQAIQELRQFYGNKIAMHGNFIIGLPGEPLESATDTFNLIMNNTIPLDSFYFQPLYIDQTGLWNSEFGRNYEKYGYKKIGDNGGCIDWQNEYTTFGEASELAQKFDSLSQSQNRTRMGGEYLWSMMNYGYSLDHLLTSNPGEITWDEAINAQEKYIKQYKEELNKLLDSNK